MGLRGIFTATPSFLLRARIALGLALALSAFSGCTNNLLQNARALATSVTSTDPLAGLGDGGSALTLARVQLDTFAPSTTLDLIGDGTGSMGQSCGASSASGAPAGASTCTCAFSYVQSDGTTIGPVEVDTTYHESNMVRCPYSSIPAGTSTISVYLHLTNYDTKSNTVDFKFGNGASAIDLSNALNFTKVQRYQCRDIVTIPYMWDTGIYDPFLSEDPKYSYPLNFYTTNMGGTMAFYAGDTNAVGWNCPPLPNDSAAGMDLTVFSVAADASGSKKVFPPQNSLFDRSTFYVANKSGGSFTIPLNAYTYPTRVTAVQATGGNATAGPGPLGYAASPVPLSGGGETCPDSSVTIPSGYHWAKLWLFRKQLPQRAYPSSNALQQFGGSGIACNSKPWTQAPVPAAPNDTYFSDCSGASSVVNTSSSAYGLAARFSLSTGACFNIMPGGTTKASTKANYDGTAGNQHPNASYTSFDFTVYAPGSDIWQPNNKDTTYGCTGTGPTDLSHACQSTTGNVPFDSDITQGLIDSTTANPRYDFLFVVSPTSVNRSDMDITSPTATHSVYTPMRFMSPTDCKSQDPDSPMTAGDCSPSRMLVYDLVVTQAGSPGQTGSSDPNAPGPYPLCVLQPN